MTTPDIALTATQAAPHARYDRVTMTFHWLTAISVIALFGSSYWWNSLPGGTPLRKGLQAFHVSIGILFVLIVAGRLIWRWTRGRRLAAANSGTANILAKAVHGLLYLLIVAQIVLGFALRWAQGEEFYFFVTFYIPEMFGPSKDWEKIFEPLHNYNAWLIVILAGGHAIAALFHHYVLKDSVLKRMVPIR